MYGAILGKNRIISLKELELVHPQNMTVQADIVFFDTETPEKLNTLGGIIKWGNVVQIKDIGKADIIGTNDSNLGKYLKKSGLTRRFKEIETTKTDEEVKKKGKEYIVRHDNRTEESDVLEITGYQDIGLYETIDFDKPVNSMNIGMMPSKLALTMINIGLATLEQRAESKEQNNNVTIYDPFVGLGTTAFLANTMGYDCIASDIDITAMKRNQTRREENPLYKKDKRITLFKHDIFEPLKKPFLNTVNLIVTEGWLGPVITDRTGDKEIFKAQDEIVKLYKSFFENVINFYKEIVVVCTIPIHLSTSSYVKEALEEWCKDKGINAQFLSEIYKRPNQKVGRQIVIVTK